VGGDPVRAGDRAGGVVDVEVVAVELVVIQVRVPCERPRLDHDLMVGVAEFRERVARSVCGIGQHVEPGWFISEQLDAGRSVTGIGSPPRSGVSKMPARRLKSDQP
jgi:hypothetical protein